MSLLEEIKKNSDVRSLFGKQELLIIEKQLLAVKLKPSEKTRLSRDIRKKFRAIQALSQFKEEFMLKHGSKLREIIKDTKEAILKSSYSNKIKRIVLFGSTLDRERNLMSDIDIAVEFFDITNKTAVKFRLGMMHKVDKRVDIRVYNTLPEKIKFQIDNGKTVYQRAN